MHDEPDSTEEAAPPIPPAQPAVVEELSPEKRIHDQIAELRVIQEDLKKHLRCKITARERGSRYKTLTKITSQLDKLYERLRKLKNVEQAKADKFLKKSARPPRRKVLIQSWVPREIIEIKEGVAA
jgi:hypothetical protein